MIALDLRSRQPIYEQLVEKLKNLIITGVLKSDEQLPSVRQLALQLTINPNTIQKAYRDLEQHNYIYSLPGKGSFVAPLIDQDREEKLKIVCVAIEQLLTEAFYLGLTQDQLLSLYGKVESTLTGAHKNAENQESIEEL